MGIESKENRVLELFFNEGTKHWHFKDIVKKSRISQDRANYWLKKMMKHRLIRHIKPKKKMPYFIADFYSPEYKNRKKLFALELLYKSGLLNHLEKLEKAKAVVIFGSFSRSDWYSESDIDVFILGEIKDLEIGRFETILKREIQIHEFRDKKEIKSICSGLIHNVINGYFVKGQVHDLVGVSI